MREIEKKNEGTIEKRERKERENERIIDKRQRENEGTIEKRE